MATTLEATQGGISSQSPAHARSYPFEIAFVWELTTEPVVLPLGCLQGGEELKNPFVMAFMRGLGVISGSPPRGPQRTVGEAARVRVAPDSLGTHATGVRPSTLENLSTSERKRARYKLPRGS